MKTFKIVDVNNALLPASKAQTHTSVFSMLMLQNVLAALPLILPCSPSLLISPEILVSLASSPETLLLHDCSFLISMLILKHTLIEKMRTKTGRIDIMCKKEHS
jgi:hypothetical protein